MKNHLASLFANSTVYQEVKTPLSKVLSLGLATHENQLELLVLAQNSTSPEMQREDTDFLGKIIASVKLSEQDYQLYWQDELSDINHLIKAKNLLVFGIHPSRMALNIQVAPYKLLKLESLNCCFCGSLQRVREDQNSKRFLWASLKKMFNV